jgi:hypothetical protein
MHRCSADLYRFSLLFALKCPRMSLESYMTDAVRDVRRSAGMSPD